MELLEKIYYQLSLFSHKQMVSRTEERIGFGSFKAYSLTNEPATFMQRMAVVSSDMSRYLVADN